MRSPVVSFADELRISTLAVGASINPSEGWQDVLKQSGYGMKPIFTSEGRKLWQLKQKSENS